MDSCVIRVMGDNFDPDDVLKELTLKPSTVFRRGEIRAGRRRISKTSGITFELGDGTFEEQVQVATRILNRHRDELKSLSKIATVESFFLELLSECRLDDNEVMIQRDFLPAELIQIAGEVGIGICINSVNPTEESEDASESAVG